MQQKSAKCNILIFFIVQLDELSGCPSVLVMTNVTVFRNNKHGGEISAGCFSIPRAV